MTDVHVLLLLASPRVDKLAFSRCGLGDCRDTFLRSERKVLQAIVRVRELILFGNIFEAFTHRESFDLFICPKCGKVEFFTPPFNLFEQKVWENDKFTYYENSGLKVSSLETLIYMKTMAFWNRKKYRDLFDIYYILL